MTGLTTKEMQTAQTFIDAGWNEETLEDGTLVWKLEDGRYPRLWYEKEPLKHLIQIGERIVSYSNGLIEVTKEDTSENMFVKKGIEGDHVLNKALEDIENKKYKILTWKSND